MPRKKRETEPDAPYFPTDGMAPPKPPSVPEIDHAAEVYVGHRDDRMEALKEEIKAHDVLLTLMQSHGMTSYEWNGHVVTVDNKVKVKVRRKSEEAD